MRFYCKNLTKNISQPLKRNGLKVTSNSTSKPFQWGIGEKMMGRGGSCKILLLGYLILS
jgi:hypothetical protein